MPSRSHESDVVYETNVGKFLHVATDVHLIKVSELESRAWRIACTTDVRGSCSAVNIGVRRSMSDAKVHCDLGAREPLYDGLFSNGPTLKYHRQNHYEGSDDGEE